MKITKIFSQVLNNPKFFISLKEIQKTTLADGDGGNLDFIVADIEKDSTKIVLLSDKVRKAVSTITPKQFSRESLNLTDLPDSLIIIAGEVMFMLAAVVIAEKMHSKDMYLFYSIDKDNNYDITAELIGLNPVRPLSKDAELSPMVSKLAATLTYMFYGDITTKVCKPKVKYNLGKYNTFNHKLPTAVHYVDTTWKQRINTLGFPVKGHFRLQKYLTGPKLIWIEAFKKNGYNRKAGIEQAGLADT